tara:strand:- start:4864 stop:5100 length:237 start_codon:yes stop_codon:yes gene_type:complete
MEMLSLYDYLKKAAGAGLGKRVAAEAVARGVKIEDKEISNPKYEGTIKTYPREFLEHYFSTPPADQQRPEPEESDLPF